MYFQILSFAANLSNCFRVLSIYFGHDTSGIADILINTRSSDTVVQSGTFFWSNDWFKCWSTSPRCGISWADSISLISIPSFRSVEILTTYAGASSICGLLQTIHMLKDSLLVTAVPFHFTRTFRCFSMRVVVKRCLAPVPLR